MSGEEVARELINILSVMLGVESRLLAAMRDRASVNNAAMRVVSIVYPNVLDVGCFSHTLDIVGEKFKFSADFVHCGSLFSRTALKQKPFGKRKQEKLWPHTAKHAGGVDGKFYTNN